MYPIRVYNGYMEQKKKKGTSLNPNIVGIHTRYPKTVREALRKYAKEDHRSFNGEVIHVLQDYITEREKRNKEDAPT